MDLQIKIQIPNHLNIQYFDKKNLLDYLKKVFLKLLLLQIY